MCFDWFIARNTMLKKMIIIILPRLIIIAAQVNFAKKQSKLILCLKIIFNVLILLLVRLIQNNINIK